MWQCRKCNTTNSEVNTRCGQCNKIRGHKIDCKCCTIITIIPTTKEKLRTETWLCGPPPAHGQKQRYPSRFLYNLKRNYPSMTGKNVLHMFSGSCSFGISTDIRKESKPDICAPYDKIPLEDCLFDAILGDPPYANHYANEWHSKLPMPKRILKEAVRLVKPEGLIGILHILIIPAYKELKVERIALHPILTGPNNVIRVFNVFRAKK